MQNKYVGDIGDYGKYGLLRALCGFRDGDSGERLSLGVVWCFVTDQSTSYLDRSDQLAKCDQPLFDTLFKIVKDESRNITSIRNSQVLPGAIFYEVALGRGRLGRELWLDGALKETAKCRLVFFDPDNGLESGSVPSRGVSSKYIYHTELKPSVDRGQSVVIYHHVRSPRGGVRAHIRRLADDLRAGVESQGEVWALLHQRYTLRTYFIIPNLRDRDVLEERIADFLGGPWGQSRSKREKPHFERIV